MTAPRLLRILLLTALVCLFPPSLIFSQVTPAPTPDTPPVVLEITAAKCPAGDACRIKDILAVDFKNLVEWRTDPKSKTNDSSQLVLVLNGKVMKGIYATGPSTAQPNQLLFSLRRMDVVDGDQTSKDNRDAWNTILSGSKLLGQNVAVGVALGGSPPYIGTKSVQFNVLPRYWIWVAGFHIGLLVLFLLLAKNSDMLRDGATVGGPAQPWWKLGKRAPGAIPQTFSLARCQMAWWFFIVVSAYSFIWLVTGDTDTLTPGALIMIGISAATGFSAFLVDSSKKDQRATLETERGNLSSRIDALKPLVAAFPLLAAGNPPPPDQLTLTAELHDKQARQAEVDQELHSLPLPAGASQGFFKDILRDETGISFHRFQMAAWTIVLGFVFVVAVYRSLAMPDFSPTLLGLMGISAGTYVGFKIPNAQK